MDPDPAARRLTGAAVSTARPDVVEEMAAVGVVPVITLESPDDAPPLAEALVAGGLRVVEITLRTAAGVDAIRRIAAGDAVVGAGTVVEPSQVDAAVEAGARFVVSPGSNPGVIERARELDVVVLPGIATPTELMSAARLGLDLVKFFPAEPFGGATTVRALSSVMPGMRFVPTGGIAADTAGSYLALDSVLAVGGSWMVPNEVVAGRDWTSIERLAGECGRLASEVRCRPN